MVKVRFAPSPTGNLHIGGARTALFNYMYAKSQKGTFVLRIEDTDQERSKEEFLEEILRSMKWLGMEGDELYRQSERFDIYREYADKLLKEEKAYNDGPAVILKMMKQDVKLYDLIRGEIQFDTEILKDEVLMKSDGSPTYSFACVVDDALMGITHVIRGEDHISNTPKQMMIYQALGFKIPKFAHLPLIMGEDGGRLSKRTGAVAVSDYKEQGYLPDALMNYLMLLGWAPGNNQEIISMKAAIQKFSIKKVNKAAAVFSLDKLKWVNAQYVKQASDESLLENLIPLLLTKGFISETYDKEYLKKVVGLYKRRMATLTDFVDRTKYLFAEEVPFDQEAKQKHLTLDRTKEFKVLAERFQVLESFDIQTLEQVFREVVGELGIKSATLVHPLRVALTGEDVGIGLFDSMEILGKEKTIKRIREAFNK